MNPPDIFRELVEAVPPDEEHFTWYEDEPYSDGMTAPILCQAGDCCIWHDTKTNEWLYALREHTRSATPLDAYRKRNDFPTP
jgi:hypothetical protein